MHDIVKWTQIILPEILLKLFFGWINWDYDKQSIFAIKQL